MDMDSFDGLIYEICGGISCLITSLTSTSSTTSHFEYVTQCRSLDSPTIISSPTTINPQHIAQSTSDSPDNNIGSFNTISFSDSDSDPENLPSELSSPLKDDEEFNEELDIQIANQTRIPHPQPHLKHELIKSNAHYLHQCRGYW